MRHTVIGVFHNDALAEEARNLLVDWGIPSDNVFVHGAPHATNQSSALRSNISGERPVKRIFRSLIGMDDQERNYAEAVDDGEYIVVAEVDPDRTDEVSHLLDDSGAVDIGLSPRFN
ncbi:MAG TPA: hypothetical protein VJM53_06015 [Burkholderiales bacterium]|jgi:hypothetical protein|nr:hypothetical protein [Burkholderiales bacterium]